VEWAETRKPHCFTLGILSIQSSPDRRPDAGALFLKPPNRRGPDRTGWPDEGVLPRLGVARLARARLASKARSALKTRSALKAQRVLKARTLLKARTVLKALSLSATLTIPTIVSALACSPPRVCSRAQSHADRYSFKGGGKAAGPPGRALRGDVLPAFLWTGRRSRLEAVLGGDPRRQDRPRSAAPLRCIRRSVIVFDGSLPPFD